MTTIQHITRSTARLQQHTRGDRMRRRLAVGAMIATIPYSLLKVAWLSGSRIGLSDPEFGTDVTMHVANTLTLGFDIVALVLAAIFFTGTRAPRWFLLTTMWIAYGLLGQIVVMIGPAVLAQLVSGPPMDDGVGSPIAGWVYAAVYTGFSGLGLCLLPAFAIYAWQRWAGPNAWGERLSGIRRELPGTPSVAAAVLTVALAARAVGSASASEATAWISDALIGLITVLTLLAAGRGRPTRLRRAVPLAVAWTASGAWTAWGCFNLVLGTVPNDLMDDSASAVDIMLHIAKIAVGALLLLTVRRLASSDHAA